MCEDQKAIFAMQPNKILSTAHTRAEGDEEIQLQPVLFTRGKMQFSCWAPYLLTRPNWQIPCLLPWYSVQQQLPYLLVKERVLQEGSPLTQRWTSLSKLVQNMGLYHKTIS